MNSSETGERLKGLGLLSLTALGVVFGDIGTSPLYTLHECLGGQHGVVPGRDNVLGPAAGPRGARRSSEP